MKIPIWIRSEYVTYIGIPPFFHLEGCPSEEGRPPWVVLTSHEFSITCTFNDCNPLVYFFSSSVIIDHIQQCIDDAGCNVASAFPSGCYDIRNVSVHDQFFGLDHVDEAYRNTDDEFRIQFLILDEFIKTHQSRGGISDGKDQRFLKSQCLVLWLWLQRLHPT